MHQQRHNSCDLNGNEIDCSRRQAYQTNHHEFVGSAPFVGFFLFFAGVVSLLVVLLVFERSARSRSVCLRERMRNRGYIADVEDGSTKHHEDVVRNTGHGVPCAHVRR